MRRWTAEGGNARRLGRVVSAVAAPAAFHPWCWRSPLLCWNLRRKLCLVCTRRAATAIQRRFSFLKAPSRRSSVCVVAGQRGGLSSLRLARWCWVFVAPDVCFLPVLGALAPSSLVKNRNCLAWGASRLGNDGAPRSSSCVPVLGCWRRRVALAVCSPSWEVGAARLL